MDAIVISEYYNNKEPRSKAVVVKNRNSYSIEYYDMNGLIFHTEKFEGHSLHYVEDAAENWALGIKVLNG
jgi:hypothetical protein